MSHMPNNHLFNLTNDEDLTRADLRGLPKSSWWTEPAVLADFFARARAEEARMAISRNGKAVQLIFGRDHGRTSSKDTVTELEAR